MGCDAPEGDTQPIIPTQKQFANAILRYLRETIPSEWKVFREQVSENVRVITHEEVRFSG